MAIKDFVPSLKSVGIFAAGVVVAGVVSVGVVGMQPAPVFVPSAETCDRYFETRNGRFICIISGHNVDEEE